MAKSRIKSSILNSTISLINYFVVSILQFVNRSVFVYCLSSEFLGLNGLFTNIISFLSLAELGVGSAMTYALYKPLQSEDKEQIKSIMYLYKKLYTIIGFLILILGFSLAPFLNVFFKDVPQSIDNIQLYYCLYVINSGVSYFLTYKRTLIICDQKQYISSITTTVKNVLTSLLQILFLLHTKSYFLYLLSMGIFTVLENLAISKIANKNYPYLKEKNIVPLDTGIKNQIVKNISAMIFHKLGSVVVFSTDNIIISKFIGIIEVGLYSNYLLITNTLANVVSQVFNSLVASVGNLVAEDDKKATEVVFERILFFNYWIYAFCTVCLFALLNPFIEIWLGTEYIFDQFTVLIICLNFYFTGMRRTVGIFKDASGLFWHDRFKPIIESLSNILLSIPLAIKFNVAGVLLGTILTTIIFSIPIETQVLFKNYFCKSSIQYYKKQIYLFGVTIFTMIVCYFVVAQIQNTSILFFCLKMCICAIIPNLIIAVLNFKNPNLKYFYNLFKKMVIKK